MFDREVMDYKVYLHNFEHVMNTMNPILYIKIFCSCAGSTVLVCSQCIPKHALVM